MLKLLNTTLFLVPVFGGSVVAQMEAPGPFAGDQSRQPRVTGPNRGDRRIEPHDTQIPQTRMIGN